MVISEPGVLIGRSLIQWTTRHGEALPHLVSGGPILYKQLPVPLFRLMAEKVDGYELSV